MVGVAVLYWLGVALFVIWLWSDATVRHGAARGLLWTLLLLVGGPVGVIVYLIYGRRDPPGARAAAPAARGRTAVIRAAGAAAAATRSRPAAPEAGGRHGLP